MCMQDTYYYTSGWRRLVGEAFLDARLAARLANGVIPRVWAPSQFHFPGWESPRAAGNTLVAQITWSVKPYLREGAKHEPFACQPVVFIPSYFFILLAAQRVYIVRGPRRATSFLITFVHLQRYISLFPPPPPPLRTSDDSLAQ